MGLVGKQDLLGEDNNVSIKRQCELLNINRTSYYYKKVTSSLKERELEEEIKKRINFWHTKIGKPLDPRNMQRTFKTILRKAGIGNRKVHCLRHSFASRGLECGIELKVIRNCWEILV